MADPAPHVSRTTVYKLSIDMSNRFGDKLTMLFPLTSAMLSIKLPIAQKGIKFSALPPLFRESYGASARGMS